jgi:hypothetical protein
MMGDDDEENEEDSEDMGWNDSNVISSGGEAITDISKVTNLPAMPEGLQESKPVKYSGNDDLKISGRYIRTDGDGIIIGGNGDVVISNCYIVVGKNGIIVSGNNDVEIKNCFILGAQSALIVGGNATVNVSDTRFRGKVLKQGFADFEDKGGNTFE